MNCDIVVVDYFILVKGDAGDSKNHTILKNIEEPLTDVGLCLLQSIAVAYITLQEQLTQNEPVHTARG